MTPRFQVAVLRDLSRLNQLKRLSTSSLVKVSSSSANPARTFVSTIQVAQESQFENTHLPANGIESRYRDGSNLGRAPVSLRRYNPGNRYEVNEDPEVLDAVYRQVLGERGDSLLSDDVKWLAVTHKSFDQGRRGYNDRLAFYGKRIIDLQTSLALLNRPDGTFIDPPDEYEREPFRNPGVDLLQRLTEESKSEVVSLARIANLAHSLGLLSVVRWKPKNASNLAASGVDRVLSQALYAIMGAVALQNGGEVAVRVVRESILSRLGLKA